MASRRGAASGRGILPTAPRRPAQAMKVLLLCLADPMAATFLSYTAPETGHTLTVCTRAPGRRQSVDTAGSSPRRPSVVDAAAGSSRRRHRRVVGAAAGSSPRRHRRVVGAAGSASARRCAKCGSTSLGHGFYKTFTGHNFEVFDPKAPHPWVQHVDSWKDHPECARSPNCAGAVRHDAPDTPKVGDITVVVRAPRGTRCDRARRRRGGSDRKTGSCRRPLGRGSRWRACLAAATRRARGVDATKTRRRLRDGAAPQVTRDPLARYVSAFNSEVQRGNHLVVSRLIFQARSPAAAPRAREPRGATATTTA